MSWEEAAEKIRDKDNIHIGTDLNNRRTRENSYRQVLDIQPLFFRIQIGKDKSSRLDITWRMLESCWRELSRTGRYDTKVFDKCCPWEKSKHGCWVHTVGKIFEKAGLVVSINDDFYLLCGDSESKMSHLAR